MADVRAWFAFGDARESVGPFASEVDALAWVSEMQKVTGRDIYIVDQLDDPEQTLAEYRKAYAILSRNDQAASDQTDLGVGQMGGVTDL